MANVGWDRFTSLGHPSKFQRVFASCLRYCSDVAHRRHQTLHQTIKLCTLFGRLLGWVHNIYIFRNFARCKIHFTFKSCVLLYWHGTPAVGVSQTHSVIQGMELQNFRRGHHLSSVGRPSRWALVHIPVLLFFLAYSQPSQNGCVPYFNANLECISEMCCTRLAENTRRKKSPKIRDLATIAQLCLSVSSQPRHVSTMGKTCSTAISPPHVLRIW